MTDSQVSANRTQSDSQSMDDVMRKRLMLELCENATLTSMSTTSVTAATPLCSTTNNCSASTEGQ